METHPPPPLQLTLPFVVPPPPLEPSPPVLPQHLWTTLSVEQQTHFQHILIRIFQEVLDE
jgi:hypothetical protein